MKYLIIGKNGQLGSEFVRKLTAENKNFSAFGHQELDISNIDNLREIIASEKPEVVINTSAYNLVDLAEKNLQDAYRTNYLGVYNLLLTRQEYRFRLVHYSTDYVFDGLKDTPYTEEDYTGPLSEYARSKYLGEDLLVQNSENTLIFRVSWVFGQGQQNFIYKFRQWAGNNPELRISDNEVSVPTYTGVITDYTLLAIEKGLTGLYHLTNSGQCSRFEWAKLIAETLNLSNKLIPADMNEFKLPARRPGFSAMSNKKLAESLDVEIPHWSVSVREYLKP